VHENNSSSDPVGSSVRLADRTNAWAEVIIHNITFGHNLSRNGVQGMTVNVDLTVVGYAGVDLRLATFFYSQGSGQRVAAAHANNFRSPTGGVTVQQRFTVDNMRARRSLSMFVPYGEFNVPAGKNHLFARAEVQLENSHQPLVHSSAFNFNYTAGGSQVGVQPNRPMQPSQPLPIWVSNPTDHDITLRYRTDDPSQPGLNDVSWVMPAHHDDMLTVSGQVLSEDGQGFFQFANSRWRALRDMAQVGTVLNKQVWKLILSDQ